MHEDIVGLEHDVGLKLSTPVAIFMLLVQKPVLGSPDAVNDVIQTKIEPSESRLDWLIRRPRIL